MTEAASGKYNYKTIATYIFFSISISAQSFASDLKTYPTHPTVEACTEYLKSHQTALKVENTRQVQCMSDTEPKVSHGSECSYTQKKVIFKTAMAWPHCENAAYECSLNNAVDKGFACLAEARRKMPGSNSETLDAEKKASALIYAYNQKESAFTNPAKFINEKILTQVSRESKDHIVKSYFNPDGEINPNKHKEINQTYDWIFNKIDLTPGLLSSNPLINAIQADSFNGIESFHQNILMEFNSLQYDIDKFDQMPTQPKPVMSASQSSTNESSECSILSDGIKSSNLANENPDFFYQLMEHCE